MQRELPDWMKQPENYSPPSDRDRFIDKSILSFLNTLSKIKQQSRHDKDLLLVSPFFKLIFTVLFIVLVSSTQNFAFLYIMLAYVIILLAVLPPAAIKSSLKGALVAALFTYLILIPSALTGNHYSITMIPVKVLESVLAVNILSFSTRWDHIIASLRRLFFPSLVIFIFDIMIKYIVLLGEYALQMLYALKLRSVGKNKEKYGSIAGVGGSLFVKSRAMSQTMYQAMECRGFDGEYKITDKFRFTVWDAAYILLNGVFVYLFYYFQHAA
ncbi:MAG: energy-coupling factor transporter transmembrane component T [Acutalibacteraceae bacterium]|nr:energy-coupling factor transporter transmembrane component T [Acutalibacteraceae bacterium]